MVPSITIVHKKSKKCLQGLVTVSWKSSTDKSSVDEIIAILKLA